MSKLKAFITKELTDYKILLRNIPSPTILFFTLSVVCANLMANKEFINFKYLALDCGFVFSWIMFLCMDVICKRWGAKASVKISVFALLINLCVCVSFFMLSKTPGNWAEFYTHQNELINQTLNKTSQSNSQVAPKTEQIKTCVHVQPKNTFETTVAKIILSENCAIKVEM